MEPLDTSAAAGEANPHSFRVLMRRVLEGSEEASRELQERYAAHVLRVVRRRLPRLLRPKFDSLDFAQDVWASFFRTPDRQFESPEQLIAFLTRVARNKVVDAARERLGTRKHDLRREMPLDQPVAGHVPEALVARDGTPSQAAIGRELWQQMLAGEPPAYRKVLLMLREGQTQVEVAQALNLSVRTVQRILERAFEKTRP